MPAYRLIDLTAEVGELAADTTASREYGTVSSEFAVNTDELGDTLFALLVVDDELGIDADDADDASRSHYRSSRIESERTVRSGEQSPTLRRRAPDSFERREQSKSANV
ncbi:hypothetical protein SAMN04487950_2455 [Halogranum rubrum]|uniref:Uncharacterized protein n=1 Tax=Halogranum rubrum TaxID=553466 RepID=A0A1I4F186_9EURY|nr:hypothetical protein SAMN04487950_2455 [Halogranum rubrum]